MIILLTILLLGLGIYFFLYIREIKKLEKQLDFINKEEKTNKRISLSFHGLGLDNIATQINKLINKHNQKERELDHEKTRIKNQITSISHDLRTPLTSIMGYLDLIENNKNAEETRDYMTIVKKKSQGLQKLIDDFYEISLLEDESYDLEKEKTSPAYILEDSIMEYYKEIEDANISLVINIQDDREIESNPKALRRVYNNLLSNIKKHAIKEAQIYHGLENNKLVTKFINQVAEEEGLEIDRIFEKFYTGEKSRHSQNTGIGMYSTKVLLDKLGHNPVISVDRGLLEIKIEY